MAMIPQRGLNAIWLLILILSGLPQPGPVHSQSPPKAIILAWDGAVSSFVQAMLDQQKLPNLAKLIDGGAFADTVISTFPSLTAPSFASIWTGAPPPVTGISGNRVPRVPQNQHTILEYSMGFNSALLLAEPLWAVAQRAGRRFIVAHVPFGGEKSGLGVHFQGYGGIAGRDGVVNGNIAKPRPAIDWRNLPQSDRPPLEIQFTIGSTPFFGLLFDDPTDADSGYDTFLVARSKNGQDAVATLKGGLLKSSPRSFWSGVIDVSTSKGQKAQCYFRLFELKPDGSDFLLYHTMLTREMVFPADLIPKVRTELGIFIGNGASQTYAQGGLGPTIPKGGSGLAETRYLETVAFSQRQLMRVNSWALKNLPWDFFVAYTPFPDEAEHQWRGYVDSSLSGKHREVADRLRPYLEQVYQSCDEFLGLLMANRPENTILALISDHGMEGVTKSFGVNRALQMAGLVATDDQGRIDLTKTRVLYPSANNGYLLINSTNRKNGVVAPEERMDLLAKIRDVMFAVRDGDRQVVTAVYDAKRDGESLGIGGLSGGDIYVDLASGYDFDWRMHGGSIIAPREPIGAHGFNPLRPSMRTIMVINGPGIAPGRRLVNVRLIDVAPTLAKLLSLPLPKDAMGRVLAEALVESR